ncbi:putative PGG domain-containing protein [Helianthus debilis subsp. tardiflorus]
MEVETRDEQPDRSSTHRPFSYFNYNPERDSADQVRGALLVVAALVASASFQAMMSFPDALKEKDGYKKLWFIIPNSLSLSFSFVIIEMLTSTFPFQTELRLSYFFMGAAYGVIFIEQLTDLPKGLTLIILTLCIILPWLLRSVPNCIKNMCGCC